MITRIDLQKCTGCGTCFKTCALDVFRLDTRQSGCSPCRLACPAGIDIRAANYLLQQSRIQEAAELFRDANPFPAITGRICAHPCESRCSRREVDESVNINAIEQFLGDHLSRRKVKPPPRRHLHRTAVVGGGLAGLSCAHFLARRGYPVTLFESGPKAGGMARTTIPEYRLPETLIDEQIRQLKAMGVVFECRTTIGRGKDLSLEDLCARGYKAAFLALGAQKSQRTQVEGVELGGVYWGLDFLRAVKSWKSTPLGQKTLVIGGTDVAVDAAVCALRLGAREVDLACLEDRANIPANLDNVTEALAEGVKFHFSCGPERIVGKQGRVSEVLLARWFSPCARDGNFRPPLDEKETISMPADAVIFAIGQVPETSAFAEDLKLTPSGTIAIDPVTLETSMTGVFAGGDGVTGPASAIGAIAAGREAAESIDRHIQGRDLHSVRNAPTVLAGNLPCEGIEKAVRRERTYLPPDDRLNPFTEFRRGFEVDDALRESLRCMTCGSKAYVAYDDDCMTCFTCELWCPSGAVYVHPFKEVLPRTIKYPAGGR